MGEAVHESEVSHIIAVPRVPPPAPWPSLGGCVRRAAGWFGSYLQRNRSLDCTKGPRPPQEPQAAPVSLQGGWDLDCVSVGSRGGGSGSGYWLPWVWGWGWFAGSMRGGRSACAGSGGPQLDPPPARQLRWAATRCGPSLESTPSTGWAPRRDW